MADSVDIDFRELVKLAADLDRVPDTAVKEARRVVQKGSLNIKNDWRQAWSGMRHAPLLPRTVTYDTTETPTAVEGEIGPDKNLPQGALGNLIEFGSKNNAPRPGGLPALEAEEPRFVKALEDLAVKAIER